MANDVTEERRRLLIGRAVTHVRVERDEDDDEWNVIAFDDGTELRILDEGTPWIFSTGPVM